MSFEIFVGFVAPVGVLYSVALEHLEVRLGKLGVDVEKIKLSELIKSVPTIEIDQYQTEDGRIAALMKAGNEARQALEDKAALAWLAVLEVRNRRRKRESDGRISKPVAYIFLTLKTPQEISFLRNVYDDSFVSVSIFQPRERRVSALAAKIGRTNGVSDLDRYRAAAENLVKLDEEDGADFGQRVSDSFAESDYFANVDNRQQAHVAIDRLVDIVFGHPFITPSIDEYGMFLAWGVSLRSADLSRQVGAAACDARGNLIAVGCNDVPRAGGGQYWPSADDARDFQRGFDSSAAEKRNMIGEVLARLKEGGWLSDAACQLTPDARLDQALNPLLKGSLATSLLEFGRIIHAEMAAIADAARRGLALDGATLYTTTFPCHVCARHVVAAGIRRVVYIEPYPKSRARDLHEDSIAFDSAGSNGKVLFEGFNGVAPRRYGAMFRIAGKRKDDLGVAVPPEATIARLRLIQRPSHVRAEELKTASLLNKALAALSKNRG